MNTKIDNRESHRRDAVERSDIRNKRPVTCPEVKRIVPSWAAEPLFRLRIQAVVKTQSRGLNSISKHRTPGAARSARQRNPKLMKRERHKVTDVHRLPGKMATLLNGPIRKMWEILSSRVIETVVFSGVEHLRVQQEIERRAHELWHAGGCLDGTALNDWLQAERGVLEQFITAYAQ
jgi:hypothetical protein